MIYASLTRYAGITHSYNTLLHYQHRDIFTHRIGIDRNHDPATGAFLEPAVMDVIAVRNDIGHYDSLLNNDFLPSNDFDWFIKTEHARKRSKNGLLTREYPNPPYISVL